MASEPPKRKKPVPAYNPQDYDGSERDDDTE